MESILTKLLSVREKMVAQGLDKLVVKFGGEVSSEEAVGKAVYGEYLATMSKVEMMQQI